MTQYELLDRRVVASKSASALDAMFTQDLVNRRQCMGNCMEKIQLTLDSPLTEITLVA